MLSRVGKLIAVAAWGVASLVGAADPPPAGNSPPKNTLGIQLEPIPAGSFWMGTSERAADLYAAKFAVRPGFSNDDETLTEVHLSAFEIAAHEVTVGQFRKFVEAANHKTDAENAKHDAKTDAEQPKTAAAPRLDWKNPGFTQDDDHPVVLVSWNDAVKFCEWLSKVDGCKYRLPTEAEREYACQAGSTARFFSGDNSKSLAGYANVQDASFETIFPPDEYPAQPSFKFHDGWIFTAPVGRYVANAWHLHDMTGNVWEWCSDPYDPYYRKQNGQTKPVPESKVKGYCKAPPLKPPAKKLPCKRTGLCRVVKGGGWNSTPVYCRSANANGDEPTLFGNNLGFRVVRELP